MHYAARQPVVSRATIVCAVATYLLALFLTGCGREAHAATPTGATAFELSPRQKLTFDGRVVAADGSNAAGVTFGVIPTSLITLKPYYNVFTGLTESRPVPGNPHPIPVLRAGTASVYADKPDAGTLALDRLSGSEATLAESSKYAVVSDANGTVRLITFARVHVPQDKDAEWSVAGTVETLTLPAHLDDPVADRGRAVETKEPLALTGRLVYGVREDMMKPTEFRAIDLPNGKPVRLAEATEGRLARNGNLADRVDMRTVRVTDRHGRTLGELKFEDDIDEFAISPDGRRVAVSLNRSVYDASDSSFRREPVTEVYKVGGRKLGAFAGYDDPAFFPDGDRLVLTPYGTGDGLFVGDLTTNKVQPLTIHDGPDGGAGRQPEWARRPVVSPDGRWVAYHQGRDVFVVGTDGRGRTPVFNTPQHEPQASPVFSPDGRYIAMIVVPLNVMHGPGKLSVFDVKKHVRQPVDAAAGANSDVPMAWLP